ncbi:MAG: molybdopterin-dependent oxidoreductase [Anaerolineae bacterium]|nr:molybdopterin-dependent oxidoreductase [Anaerolineae bacterium]
MKLSRAFLLVLSLLALGVAGCAAVEPLPTATALPTPTRSPTPCAPEPIVVPTPAPAPGYADLDETTGLHFTGIVPAIDLAAWRLEVVGKVGNPLSLSYDELRCMPRIELECTLVCPGFFEDEATWAGVPLAHILELAQIDPGFDELRLVSADGYATMISVEVARGTGNFLAYEWEGEPLPIIHGFPLRAVLPAYNGNLWAKWLVKIEVY